MKNNLIHSSEYKNYPPPSTTLCAESVITAYYPTQDITLERIPVLPRTELASVITWDIISMNSMTMFLTMAPLIGTTTTTLPMCITLVDLLFERCIRFRTASLPFLLVCIRMVLLELARMLLQDFAIHLSWRWGHLITNFLFFSFILFYLFIFLKKYLVFFKIILYIILYINGKWKFYK